MNYICTTIYYNSSKLHNKYFLPLCYFDKLKQKIYLYGYYYNNYTNKYIYNRYIINYYNKSQIYNNYIITIKNVTTTTKKISLCIVTIYKQLNINNLIRTCIFYRKIGVEHITLYFSYYNISYLNQLAWIRSKDWIEIIDYQLPNISFFYYGQDSKLNHCINHYRYISDYVIVTDVDEIIISNYNYNLLEVINKYGKNNYAYIFKSIEFNVNSTFDSVFETNSKGCLYDKGYEKMIVRPEKVVSIGAHFPKIWEEEKKIIFVNVKDGYVRHARKRIKKRKCRTFYENKNLYNLAKSIEKDIAFINIG